MTHQDVAADAEALLFRRVQRVGNLGFRRLWRGNSFPSALPKEVENSHTSNLASQTHAAMVDLPFSQKRLHERLLLFSCCGVSISRHSVKQVSKQVNPNFALIGITLTLPYFLVSGFFDGRAG
jgi:hypothetical protein